MLRQNEFDPLAYIENAFLDKTKREVLPESGELSVAIPSISDYLNKKEHSNGQAVKEPEVVAVATPNIAERATPDILLPNAHLTLLEEITDRSSNRRTRFKKTLMSAPRPRRAKGENLAPKIDPELQATWETLPKSIEFLCSYYDDSVTSNYYRGDFKETRNVLIKRLLDPELSLEETSRLLGVCPATVRRYTNRKWLTHHRTTGGQRRFRLSDIVKFVEAHGRFPEE
jgi:excisionase family DNA binding protein